MIQLVVEVDGVALHAVEALDRHVEHEVVREMLIGSHGDATCDSLPTIDRKRLTQ